MHTARMIRSVSKQAMLCMNRLELVFTMDSLALEHKIGLGDFYLDAKSNSIYARVLNLFGSPYINTKLIKGHRAV